MSVDVGPYIPVQIWPRFCGTEDMLTVGGDGGRSQVSISWDVTLKGMFVFFYH